MKKIKLTQNQYAIVDDKDFAEISKHKWCACWYKDVQGFYAVRALGKGLLLMHREIMNAPKSSVTDHVNHDPLDNRRINLRVCDRRINRLNSAKMAKGYYKDKSGKYKTQITHKGKTIYLGLFSNPPEAHEKFIQAFNNLNKDFLQSLL